MERDPRSSFSATDEVGVIGGSLDPSPRHRPRHPADCLCGYPHAPYPTPRLTVLSIALISVAPDDRLTGPPAREQLLGHPLFKGASRERIEPLLGFVLIRKVPKGALLHSPGELSPLYLVISGGLRAYQLTTDGRRMVLELIGPGGFDGILPVLGKRGHFAEAGTPSIVACLEWKLVEQLSAADPCVGRNLVELVASRLERREQHLEWMAIRDPTRRLARQLAALANGLGQPAAHNGRALPKPITHQLLADMLGMRRETVTIHLRDLAKLGAVEPHARPIVAYPQKLETIANREVG